MSNCFLWLFNDALQQYQRTEFEFVVTLGERAILEIFIIIRDKNIVPFALKKRLRG